MRILLADPNRDFLSVYGQLLEKQGHRVRTAFDGTQVLTLSGESAFDFAILNENLPRVRHDLLLWNFQDRKIPVLVLLDRYLNRKTLLRPELANAYLPFPFSPEELFAALENVRNKAASTETLQYGSLSVHVSAFRFTDTDVRLTAAEIDILRKLFRREALAGGGWGLWVHALNQKLERLAGKERFRIAYAAEKGYGLVSVHE